MMPLQTSLSLLLQAVLKFPAFLVQLPACQLSSLFLGKSHLGFPSMAFPVCSPRRYRDMNLPKLPTLCASPVAPLLADPPPPPSSSSSFPCRSGFDPVPRLEKMEEDAMSGLRIDGEDQAESRKLLQEFQRSFEQVQSVLDQNRLLIHEIGRNQAARAPVGLTRNVGLIRELNSNIWRVVDLYAGLSASFTRSVEASSEGDSAATLRPDGKPPGGKRVRLH